MTASLRPTGFHHHAIKVRDLAAAEAFYVGVLGLVVERRWTYDDRSGRTGLRSLWLRVDPSSSASFLALEQASAPAAPALAVADPATGGHFLLALRIGVAEREAWRRRLAEAGHAVTHETAFTLYVSDPEGNRLGLSHYPAPADEALAAAAPAPRPASS